MRSSCTTTGVDHGSEFQNHELPWHFCIRAITTTWRGCFPAGGCGFEVATWSDFAALRHFSQPPAMHTGRDCSLAAAASTNAGGVRPCDFAQATFCAFVKQQHFFQHCSAERQPQGRF